MGFFGIKSRKQIYFRCIIGGILAIIGFLITMHDAKLNIEPVERLLLAGSVAMISFGFGYALPTLLKSKKPIQTESEYTQYQTLNRRGWNEREREIVRQRQNGRCARCHRHPPRWHYDHIDGDRSNNSMSNCQGLCPNCHDVKTYDE